jgi:small GTP-binding protein
MRMVKAKVCMLGAFSVGKTSLVGCYVHSMFSEKYLTTVGVKVDKKVLATGAGDITLVIWDLYGEDDAQAIHTGYLRGASGYLLIADGTRPATLDVAERLRQRMVEAVGNVPFVLLLNKADLTDEWRLADDKLAPWKALGCPIFKTSAKTGSEVEEAFSKLAACLQEQPS